MAQCYRKGGSFSAETWLIQSGRVAHRKNIIHSEIMPKKRLLIQYRCNSCKDCKRFGVCTKSNNGRTFNRYLDEEYNKQFQEKMKEPESVEILKKRKAIIEHGIGNIRYLMGWMPLLLRGLKKVQIEITYYIIAYNFKRLANMLISGKTSKYLESMS